MIQDKNKSQIRVHHYPILVRMFWGFVSIVFIINLFISFIYYAPSHAQVWNRINTIKKLVKNKEYLKAWQIHEYLCNAYPQNYANNYYVDIASVCFECSKQDLSFFKKGICYLEGKHLNEAIFSKLHKKIPLQLKGVYSDLFDVFYKEKNHEKEYIFVLNNEKVKQL
jgi:hypothetical protein